VDYQGYDANGTFKIGQYLYCGTSVTYANVGKYTDQTHQAKAAGVGVVGICTHVPSTIEPWLGVASLI
jgi:hypothetical protein